jgi:protein-disulfide isomerase
MSSERVRPLRRERRAATLAQRRVAPHRTTQAPRRVGIGLVTIIALIAGLVLVGAILVFGGQPKAVPAAVVPGAAPAGIPSAGQVLGSAAAPVTIDLYEDFQCPVCLSWGRNVFPSLVRNELAAGTVKIQYHGFEFLGQESMDAGRAAWAADKQGRFWDMWATIYANQGLHENGGAFSRDRLFAMAEALGLDANRFKADFDSAEATKYIADGVADAARAGVTATPTLMIGGAALASSDYPTVSAAIAAAAAR